MSKTVRLSDIAQKVGVSTVSVSKALSGKKGVSPEMREKIIKIAEEMGYASPNMAAGNTLPDNINIGVFIGEAYLDKYSSLYWKLYQDVVMLTSNMGSYAMLEVITREMETSNELPRLLKEQKIDGIIVIGRIQSEYREFLIKNKSIPLVYMDFLDEDKSADSVVSNNFEGGYQVTRYLLNMGHRKIGFAGTILATTSITDRYFGYNKALMEKGIEVKKEWLIDDRSYGDGLIDDEGFLRLPKDMPTAFFCNCDITAGKLIMKLQNAGYSVPEDISVVGYDNFIYPGLCNVAISTYEVDFTEMAKKTVEVLASRIRNDTSKHRVYVIDGNLVIKDSVKDVRS
ncbi:MAG: LacI family DNA-binding transcriptional regulator [Lachnospiraceae bacterium]|nr:LacI family DNA-binding transcriptional regulator [Lachnospiraceae bacterium]